MEKFKSVGSLLLLEPNHQGPSTKSLHAQLYRAATHHSRNWTLEVVMNTRNCNASPNRGLVVADSPHLRAHHQPTQQVVHVEDVCMVGLVQAAPSPLPTRRRPEELFKCGPSRGGITVNVPRLQPLRQLCIGASRLKTERRPIPNQQAKCAMRGSSVRRRNTTRRDKRAVVARKLSSRIWLGIRANKVINTRKSRCRSVPDAHGEAVSTHTSTASPRP